MDLRRFKENYRRYSLFVLILGLGVVIFLELTPLVGGVLGAVTLYVLLRAQMERLTAQRGWRRGWAATLLLAEAAVCFLIPLSLVVWLVVGRIRDLALDPAQLVESVRGVAALVHERTGYDLLQEQNLSSLLARLPQAGQWVLGAIADFGINMAVLLFVLYFLLVGGRRMERYCRDLMPFSREVSRHAAGEVLMIVRSNAIGLPLLALAQGVAAYVGYLIFGAPDPLFWSVVSCFATVIPVVGVALVWLPMALYLGLAGAWGMALGLALYGLVVITQTDNVVRLVLQRRMADTHPVVTVFGVVIGLPLFGFMGVIFGPLLLAMFLFCLHLFKRRYIDGATDEELFAKDGFA